MEKESKTGWKPVYTGSGAHLERVLEMYKELGYATKLEPLSYEEAQKCQVCYEADEGIYRLYIKEIKTDL